MFWCCWQPTDTLMFYCNHEAWWTPWLVKIRRRAENYCFGFTWAVRITTPRRPCMKCLPTTGVNNIPFSLLSSLYPTLDTLHSSLATWRLPLESNIIKWSWCVEPTVLITNCVLHCWGRDECSVRPVMDSAASYQILESLMPDGRAHLENETHRLVAKGLNVLQLFELQYPH